MGTGPYMFKEHILGQKLILTKNPHYFGGNVGHIQNIEADFGVDEATGLLRVERNQADMDGDGIPAADFLSVINDPKWKHYVSSFVQVALYYIGMNTLDKPFTNVLVRRAVNMAINKQLLLRLINGRGVVASTVLPPTMPGYGKFDLYPYNPAKAKQLLARAGYPNGFTTTYYSDNIGDDPRISQAVVQQLAQIGIKVNLRIVNGNTWQTIVGTKYKAPMSWDAWFEDFPDPNDFFEPILSCASAVPGTFNEPWYCDPKVDKFANRLKGMANRDQRLAQYPTLDKMVMQDAPIVPVYYPKYYDLRSTQIHNYYASPIWGWVFQDYTKS
jgi:ABC-type transport system substrate-binding protein